MLGFIRLMTGIIREKPVTQILIITIVFAIIIISYLNRLTLLICTHTIPNLYKTEILPTQQIENNWQWQYFLLGSGVLAPAFAFVVNDFNNTTNDISSSSSSCGSSCGSSCSSCGGCGGD